MSAALYDWETNEWVCNVCGKRYDNLDSAKACCEEDDTCRGLL